MLRNILIFLATFFVIIIIFAWVENEIAPSFQSCISQIPSEQSSKTSKNDGVITADLVKRQTFCSLHLIDRHAGFFAALGAFAIAAFTFTFWIAVNKQAEWTRKSIKFAYRPKIRVRRINLQGGRDDFGSLMIHLSNAGESDAVIHLIGYGMARKDNGTWRGDQPPDPRGSSVTRPDNPLLPMGPSRPFLLVVAIDDEAKAAIWENRHQLFVVGEIEYSDDSGIIRNTGFCWVYDHSIRDFRKSKEDEGYNYED